MTALMPFIRLMKPHLGWVLLGSFLGLVTLLSSIGLLTYRVGLFLPPRWPGFQLLAHRRLIT
ncbi:hypothetical protein [Nitrincola sp. A-D6]|uniref:hypothetical protein n=1 Tax=Nitrincola sp. A-D6 TaxID=1545442 RepID=UPI00068DDC45|nr:hypothetical protein [Nitrincola sp. A-D6]